MHTSPIMSAIRTHAPDLLDGIPDDVLTHIVVSHISLREGRTLTSLACVSRAFAEWMKPHRKPIQLYHELKNATEATPATALHLCMGALYDLADINPVHRLELFLCVSATLRRHFPGRTIEPHVNTLLASMAHLAPVEQPAALLGLMETHGPDPLCLTKPRYVDMAGRIGALVPCAAQSELANILGMRMAGLSSSDFAERAQAFLRMCLRLPPRARTEVTSHLLRRVAGFGEGMFYPYGEYPVDQKRLQHNKQVLLWGLHDCLQSIRMQELPVEEWMPLLGSAMIMPHSFPEAEEADKMAMSLMRMVPVGDDDSCRRCHGQQTESLDDQMEHMLVRVFERPPGQSIHRFQHLYQAMAHLPPSRQIDWMRAIMLNCAKRAEGGVTLALIVATAQAALNLDQAQPELRLPVKLLYDLFALCLNPATLRKTGHYPFVQPRAVDPAEQPGYTQRFDAKCRELMHLLQNIAPDMAGKLLVGINGAYQQSRYMEGMLPPGSLFKAELYERFLKQAIDFLRSLPPANSEACLLQWKLPDLHSTDARLADDWTSLLMKAVADISRDNDRVSVEQQTTALGDLLQNGIDVVLNSPARNQRVLAGLAAFPDAVCAHALVRLLEYQFMSFAHYDVLFANTIEAARRLPGDLRSSVLEAAVNGLTHFPDPHTMGITRSTLQQERDERLEHYYPDLQKSNPDMYAVMRPGHVSRIQGWALLLDAVQTLPIRYQSDRLIQLCDDTIFFRFSNNRLSHPDRAQCSMRLLSAIIGLPHGLRGKAFFSWLRHADRQFYEPQERGRLEAAMLPLLLALPADEGRPLLNAYLPTVWPEEERAALQQRVALHWKDAV